MIHGDLVSLVGGAAAGTKNHANVSNRMISGLLVRTEDLLSIERVAVTATLRTNQGQRILANNVPLVAFAERNDLKGGLSWGQSKLLADLDGVAASELISPMLISKGAVFIDFGCIRLSGQDELQVTLSVGAVALAAGGAVNCTWLDLGRTLQESIIGYELKEGDPSIFVSDPLAVYAFRTGTPGAGDLDAATKGDADLMFDLSIDGQTSLASIATAWAATAALYRVEAAAPRRMVVLYDDPHSARPMADVSVRMNGTDKANWAILAEVHVTMGNRAQGKAVEARSDAIARVTAATNKDPVVAATLVTLGRMPDLGSVLQLPPQISAMPPTLSAGVPRINVAGRVL